MAWSKKGQFRGRIVVLDLQKKKFCTVKVNVQNFIFLFVSWNVFWVILCYIYLICVHKNCCSYIHNSYFKTLNTVILCYLCHSYNKTTLQNVQFLDVKALCCERAVMCRVIHKSLRDFRTRLRNNQDRHGRKEHINRERDTPSFCPTLQVLDMCTLGDAAGSRQTFLAHARQSQPMGPDGLFVSLRTGSHSAGISCTIH